MSLETIISMLLTFRVPCPKIVGSGAGSTYPTGPLGFGPVPIGAPCDTICAWGVAEPAPLPDITAMPVPAAASAASSPAKTSLRITIDGPLAGAADAAAGTCPLSPAASGSGAMSIVEPRRPGQQRISVPPVLSPVRTEMSLAAGPEAALMRC